jgi:hypothetical protein
MPNSGAKRLNGCVAENWLSRRFQSLMVLLTKEYFSLSVFCFLALVFQLLPSLLKWHVPCNLFAVAVHAHSSEYTLKMADMRAIFLLLYSQNMNKVCWSKKVDFANWTGVCSTPGCVSSNVLCWLLCWGTDCSDRFSFINTDSVVIPQFRPQLLPCLSF